jgi:hypothetical protein
MKLRDQANELIFDEVDPERGALNCGFTIGEIEADLDRREEVMDGLEQKVDSHSEEKKRFLKKALEAGPRKTIRFYAKAKEADMYRGFYRELWENLMIQQFFLIKLLLEAKRNNLLVDPGAEFGFEVDIGEMDQSAVRGAIDSSDLEREQVPDTIGAIDAHLGVADGEGMSLDLDEIRSEAEELEAAEIGAGETELGGGMETAINQQIEAELEKMEAE